MPAFDYDLVIIGGGPAGSTLARLLPADMRILLVEKNTAQPPFRKPCGGLLSGDAQKALSRFELTLPVDILASPQIFAVRTIDLHSGLVRHYQRFYINTDRQKFDLWLLSLLPGHISRFRGSCRSIERLPEGGFSLILTGREGERHLRTAAVVGADGANSLVRRTLFPQKRLHHYVAIQQWFPAAQEKPFYSCVFDPETSDCYSWGISKDSYFIFGGAFAPKGCRAAFERQKAKLAAYGFRFGEPIRTEACLVLRPRSFADFCLGADGAFLIGEAAGMVSPSSLEGISVAINSAVALAEALKCTHPHRAYRRKTFSLRAKLFLKVLKCPFLYHPLLRRLVMASRLKAVRIYPQQNSN